MVTSLVDLARLVLPAKSENAHRLRLITHVYLVLINSTIVGHGDEDCDV